MKRTTSAMHKLLNFGGNEGPKVKDADYYQREFKRKIDQIDKEEAAYEAVKEAEFLEAFKRHQKADEV